MAAQLVEASNGSASCPCLSAERFASLTANLSTAYVGGGTYSAYAPGSDYPQSYGHRCMEHDLHTPPYCGPGFCPDSGEVFTRWCAEQWCWVEPGNCNVMVGGLSYNATRSFYFVDSSVELYYSYETCEGSTNVFDTFYVSQLIPSPNKPPISPPPMPPPSPPLVRTSHPIIAVLEGLTTQAGASYGTHRQQRVCAAYLAAQDALNGNADVVPTIRALAPTLQSVRMATYDTKNQRPTAISAMNDASLKFGANAVLGPAISTNCKLLSGLAAAYEVPLLSASCSSPQLSDPLEYPLFARSYGSDAHLSSALPEVLRSLGFGHAGVVYANTAYATSYFQSFMTFATEQVCFLAHAYALTLALTLALACTLLTHRASSWWVTL